MFLENSKMMRAESDRDACPQFVGWCRMVFFVFNDCQIQRLLTPVGIHGNYGVQCASMSFCPVIQPVPMLNTKAKDLHNGLDFHPRHARVNHFQKKLMHCALHRFVSRESDRATSNDAWEWVGYPSWMILCRSMGLAHFSTSLIPISIEIHNVLRWNKPDGFMCEHWRDMWRCPQRTFCKFFGTVGLQFQFKMVDFQSQLLNLILTPFANFGAAVFLGHRKAAGGHYREYWHAIGHLLLQPWESISGNACCGLQWRGTYGRAYVSFERFVFVRGFPSQDILHREKISYVYTIYISLLLCLLRLLNRAIFSSTIDPPPQK